MKIRCDLIIQNLNQKIFSNQEKLHKAAYIGLYRPKIDDDDDNNQNQIILTVESKLVSVKYKLKRIETFTKFINEGKATLKLVDDNVYLLLSNCPSLTLINFVSFLNVKLFGKKGPLKATNPTTVAPQTAKDDNNKENVAPHSSKAYVNKLLDKVECQLGANKLKVISPLCEQDLNVIMQKKKMVKVANESPISSKPRTHIKVAKIAFKKIF